MFNMTLLYMNRNIPLQAKILFGYMMLMAVIISMAAILFHEHARLRKIEADTYEIRQARRDISEIHRNITVLASLGESVIAWEDEDYHAYQTRRLRVDSLLQMLQTNHSYIFGLSQIPCNSCWRTRRHTCTKSCRCSTSRTKPTACW